MFKPIELSNGVYEINESGLIRRITKNGYKYIKGSLNY